MLRAAKIGEVKLVTSAITLTEVIKMKGSPMLKEDQEAEIRRFFLNSYISVRNVDRWIAEAARALIWKHGLQPKDSIHVATAVHYKVAYLDTYDGADMGKLNGKLAIPITIGPPATEQPEIDFDLTTEPPAAKPDPSATSPPPAKKGNGGVKSN